MVRLRSALHASLAAICLASFAGASLPARAETIVDEWAAVKPPAPVELKKVKIDPKTTAFLVLDMVPLTCNPERRPRCLASLPAMQKFLGEARKHNVMVVYSLAGNAKASEILAPVAPLGTEPVVTSVANKFIRTDLDKILKDKGITTLITVGTAAHGAVLYTASEAAFLGYKVIVPVDGASAENTYAEQAVAWTLANAPGVGANTTLTKYDLIEF